jgi:hypothetical protein
MIVCIGRSADGKFYTFHDPYGSLVRGYTGPVIEGRQVVYSRMELEKRWTADGPGSGWGRIFLP